MYGWIDGHVCVIIYINVNILLIKQVYSIENALQLVIWKSVSEYFINKKNWGVTLCVIILM